MKGQIFTLLSEMVIEGYGMEVWNQILEKASPESKGSYTSGGQYPSTELMAIVKAASENIGIPPNKLVRQFGNFLFLHLYNSSPVSSESDLSLKEFLLKVDSAIHKEVKRINPDVYLPTFEYRSNDTNQLTIFYQSKRKLCELCHGLLEASADHFDEKISIAHDECMHRGEPRCRFDIIFH